MAGLNDLARTARARVRGRICAVTGSVGKTGTKEMLRHALGAQGATHASEKSFNNHVGTPLSLARMPADTDFGIFELGTNAPGEIQPLAELVSPDVALITAIEFVHGANFAGAAAIAEEKSTIFAGMRPDGVAIINGDGEFAGYQADRAVEAGASRVVRFGANAGNDVRLLDWQAERDGTYVTAEIGGRRIEYRLGVWGRHLAINSLAVLAVVEAMGGDVDAAADMLGAVTAPPGRGMRHEVALGDGSVLVIDESYNCSPAALRAALDVLAATEPGADGRRIAVIGDMLELGDDSRRIHEDVATEIASRDIDHVLLVGIEVAALAAVLPGKCCLGHVAGADEAIAPLLKVLRPGDVVMVKGSRRIGLETLVEALRAEHAQEPLVGNG
jgi:UDP-N-acetylmuramoyl-tripeptide--D-alanyl-D-alanine ligase